MKTSDPNSLALLPAFMRQDAANKGLAKGTDKLVQAMDRRVSLLSRWDKIDEMDHAALDEMAWELNILWYDSTAPLESKRQLVKTSDQVYSTLGTRWAVETMLTAHYGPVQMREYWEYGGDPYHFKLLAVNPEITNGDTERFMYLLELVQRKSCVLESIYIGLTGELILYAGMVVHETTREISIMGDFPDYLDYSGAFVVSDATHEVNDFTADIGG